MKKTTYKEITEIGEGEIFGKKFINLTKQRVQKWHKKPKRTLLKF